MKGTRNVLMVSMCLSAFGMWAATVQVDVPLNRQSNKYMAMAREGALREPYPEFKRVSLIKLSRAQEDVARSVGAAAATSASSAGEEFTLPDTDGLKDTDLFYDTTKNPVLDQGNYGTCVTFAFTGAVGYVQDHSTDAFSQLYTLFKGYQDTGSVEEAGWDGLRGAQQLIDRIKAKDNCELYTRDDVDKARYNTLSKEAGSTGIANIEDEAKKYEEIYKLIYKTHGDFISGFMSNIHKTEKMDIRLKTLNVSQGNSANSDMLKYELNQGRKISCAFVVYGNQKGTIPFDSYRYDRATHKLTRGGNTNSTWNVVTKYPIGGHEVIIASYFVGTFGKTMFLIRNSWGGSAGDNGNYYVSEDYINAAMYEATSISM